MKPSIWAVIPTLNALNGQLSNTLCDQLGIQFIDVNHDSLTASMPVDARTKQPMGFLHGGASCALAESVGSMAANHCIDQTKQICVGLDLNINYTQSAQSGTVIAIAKPLHLGQSTQVWEIRISDEKNKLISIARFTVVILKKYPGQENPGNMQI